MLRWELRSLSTTSQVKQRRRENRVIEGEAVALEEEEEGDKRKTKMSGDTIYDVDSNPNFSSYCKLIFVIVTFHETF